MKKRFQRSWPPTSSAHSAPCHSSAMASKAQTAAVWPLWFLLAAGWVLLLWCVPEGCIGAAMPCRGAEPLLHCCYACRRHRSAAAAAADAARLSALADCSLPMHCLQRIVSAAAGEDLTGSSSVACARCHASASAADLPATPAANQILSRPPPLLQNCSGSAANSPLLGAGTVSYLSPGEDCPGSKVASLRVGSSWSQWRQHLKLGRHVADLLVRPFHTASTQCNAASFTA